MGILAEPLQYVRDLALPKGFSVCELGDQFVTANGIAEKRPASEFYKKLGCGKYAAIDGNGRGTHCWDLNRPLATLDWYDAFDLVTDFGTGEHVFDQAQIWRTIHDLMKPGGFIAFDRPCAGYEQHGFYLICPNLIAALAHANDYEVVRFERSRTTRGELIRGVLRKRTDKSFVTPQQGRYFKDLQPILDKHARRRGPDHKSKELRDAGVITRGVGELRQAEDPE